MRFVESFITLAAGKIAGISGGNYFAVLQFSLGWFGFVRFIAVAFFLRGTWTVA